MFTKLTKIGIITIAAFAIGIVVSPDVRAFAANTIGTYDIINNSIQSVDIKDREVKSVDIADNAINSQKIKDGTITASDVVPALLPRPTTLSIRQVEHTVPFPAFTMVGVGVVCEPSEQAIGGGFRIDNGAATYGRITNADLDDNNGYYVTGFNDSPNDGTTTITSIAYCATMRLI